MKRSSARSRVFIYNRPGSARGMVPPRAWQVTPLELAALVIEEIGQMAAHRLTPPGLPLAKCLGLGKPFDLWPGITAHGVNHGPSGSTISRVMSMTLVPVGPVSSRPPTLRK